MTSFYTIIYLYYLFFHSQINKETLKANLGENSLRSLRMVTDIIKQADGIENINISPQMVVSVRSARSRYRQQLEEEARRAVREGKRKSSSLPSCDYKAKCAKLRNEITSFEKDIDYLSELSEAKSCFTTLSKANALRKVLKEKKLALLELEKNESTRT